MLVVWISKESVTTCTDDSPPVPPPLLGGPETLWGPRHRAPPPLHGHGARCRSQVRCLRLHSVLHKFNSIGSNHYPEKNILQKNPAKKILIPPSLSCLFQISCHLFPTDSFSCPFYPAQYIFPIYIQLLVPNLSINNLYL